MTDADILTLCAFEEANLECDDGLAAIARVVLNRIRRRFFSDGTIAGTVFAHAQFSWTEYAMIHGRYTRVAATPQAVQDRAGRLMAQDKAFTGRWARAAGIVAKVMAGTYAGAAYARLTDDAVLYLNPSISKTPWAVPEKHVCDIGHHSFFRA
ncbi:MAG: cell wall hydrolase [Caulobacteraceae bacterium]|nr:cell wall hydrolase [Caulobacteraceae bacterium]